jgi:hypothetical protein
MLSSLLPYLPFVGFICFGLYRLRRYNTPDQLWATAVGLFGVVGLLFGDYGRAMFVGSPTSLLFFHRLNEVLDITVSVAIAILIFYGFRRK